MIVLLHSLHHTIKANTKIAKERIWTLHYHQQDYETAFKIRH